MIFGKNKEGKTLVILEKQELAQSYWSRVKRRFQKNKLAKWSLRLLIGIFLILSSGIINCIFYHSLLRL